MTEALTLSNLKEKLNYDSSTGVFVWIKANKVAGSIHTKNGHIKICLKGKFYQAHRLAWLYMTGYWPNGQIDHINGQKNDNSFANLRDVSLSENLQNQRKSHKDSKTGLLGVYFNRKNNRYYSSIWSNGKSISLGHFDEKFDAYSAYLEAKRLLHSTCTI